MSGQKCTQAELEAEVQRELEAASLEVSELAGSTVDAIDGCDRAAAQLDTCRAYLKRLSPDALRAFDVAVEGCREKCAHIEALVAQTHRLANDRSQARSAALAKARAHRAEAGVLVADLTSTVANLVEQAETLVSGIPDAINRRLHDVDPTGPDTRGFLNLRHRLRRYRALGELKWVAQEAKALEERIESGSQGEAHDLNELGEELRQLRIRNREAGLQKQVLFELEQRTAEVLQSGDYTFVPGESSGNVRTYRGANGDHLVSISVAETGRAQKDLILDMQTVGQPWSACVAEVRDWQGDLAKRGVRSNGLQVGRAAVSTQVEDEHTRRLEEEQERADTRADAGAEEQAPAQAKSGAKAKQKTQQKAQQRRQPPR